LNFNKKQILLDIFVEAVGNGDEKGENGTEWKVNGTQRGQSAYIQKVQNTKEIMQTCACCEGNI
jgi:hypothetical protein